MAHKAPRPTRVHRKGITLTSCGALGQVCPTRNGPHERAFEELVARSSGAAGTAGVYPDELSAKPATSDALLVLGLRGRTSAGQTGTMRPNGGLDVKLRKLGASLPAIGDRAP